MYKTPHDAAAFDKHYFEKHIPLAKKIPGLRKYEVSRGGVATPAGPSNYHLVALLHYDDVAAIQKAFASAEGASGGRRRADFCDRRCRHTHVRYTPSVIRHRGIRTPERRPPRCSLFPTAGWKRRSLMVSGVGLLETQKAPSRIAPTNTKTAHTASTLSFNLTSTRHTSIRVVLAWRLAERRGARKKISCCAAARFAARHAGARFACQDPEIWQQFLSDERLRM
jgi:uncharacterized protein (TIGR02118 family)